MISYKGRTFKVREFVHFRNQELIDGARWPFPARSMTRLDEELMAAFDRGEIFCVLFDLDSRNWNVAHQFLKEDCEEDHYVWFGNHFFFSDAAAAARFEIRYGYRG